VAIIYMTKHIATNSGNSDKKENGNSGLGGEIVVTDSLTYL